MPETQLQSTPEIETAPAHASHRSRLRRFRFDRPQQFAALLLLFLWAQCLWVNVHQTLSDTDYQYARCGREMWERPSPISGYFTTCGNIHDGVLAYRMAGLPLTVQRVLARQDRDTSTWEMRHELNYVRLLLHLPFMLTALILGGALWWVTRRLFGNAGGFVALALYCCSPPVVRAATYPNAEILAALGLFASIYTAMGVAHALQGPRSKWRPRIVLLAASFATAAAAHSAGALVMLPLALIFMVYVAERRRTYVPLVFIPALLGAIALVFACYAFHLDAFTYYFRSGAARLGWGFTPARNAFFVLGNSGLVIAAASASVLYLATRRSRYFGNTAPLLTAAIFVPLITTGIFGEPWFWALPFILTFISGVFADALETRHGRIFRWAVVAVVVLQAALCLASLPAIAAL